MSEPAPLTAFKALHLIPPLHHAIELRRLHGTSPVQAAVIPIAMTGKDVIGQAQTGTGKTAAFLCRS